jgi:uncharacterized integral membrane protein (TIGR00697 family)
MAAASWRRRDLVVPVLAMTAVVAASNVAVQYPVRLFGLQDFLTWGALTYPAAFFITDLTNRRFGPGVARRVVAIGFLLAVALSVELATPRIALARAAPSSPASCSTSRCSTACAGVRGGGHRWPPA